MTDQPPPPQAPQPPAAQPLSESDERLYATLAHAGIILFYFLPPLILWMVFRERSRFVDDQAKEALNFSILISIAWVAVTIVGIITLGIGFVILGPLLGIATLVLCIMAAIAANRGEMYRYPVNWRIVK